MCMVNFNGFTNKVPLYELFDFTIEEVTVVLEYMGLIDTKSTCKEESMKKYIFIHGDDQEIYNKEERDFIESVGDIYIYEEFYKKTKHGTMPCRIIAVEINAVDELRSTVFFMKEINKAIHGFTIFFIKVNEQLFIGMRVFNKNAKDDCLLSKPIETFEDFEEISERLYFIVDGDDFIDYYASLALAIEYKKESFECYDTQIIKKRGIQYQYLQMLDDIGKIYRLNLAGEISRYYTSFEVVNEYDFIEEFKSVCTELEFIESFKENIIEILFEAEEMVQLANKTEEENNLFIETTKDEVKQEYDNTFDMKEYLSDPELMIKMLKKRKGI